MTNEEMAEWFIKKAKKAIDENNLDDAEVTLIEARFKCNTECVASLLKEVQEKKALLNIKMNKNNWNVIKDNSESHETNSLKEATMSEKKDEIMKNLFMMRCNMLLMQLKVAADRIEALKSLGFVYSAEERYIMETNRTLSTGKIEDLITAEQSYEKIAEKLFPAKPKKNEKPSKEYLRMMKKPVTVSNRPGVTVRGTDADVKACIVKARIAFDANELENAKKWLEKSERMIPTLNARELLEKVLAAIAARDAPKVVPNVDPEVNPDTVADPKSTVAHDLEDMNDQTNSDPTPISTAVPDNIIGASKFLDNAEKAYDAGDFKKSEHYLFKAQRMDPRLNLESKLKQVKDAMDNLINTSRKNPVTDNRTGEPERSVQTNNLIKDEADTYIQVAKNALNDKNYDRALIFLNKAEKLFSSDRAKDLMKQVVNAKLEHKIDMIVKDVRNDIRAGKLEEAEKKLTANKVPTCHQLENLREEVKKLKLTRNRLNKPKPVKIVPPPKEMLSDICNENFIKIAEKAYYDGDFKKADRFLKKAEHVHTSKRAKDISDKVKIALEEKRRQVSEKPVISDSNRAAAETTTETNDDDEVQKFLNSGLDDMQKQNYDNAELWFQKAFVLKPCKSIEELISAAQSEIKKRNDKTGPLVTPKIVEGNQAATEETPETNVNNEMKKLLQSGLDDMQKQKSDDAGVSFQKAFNLKPCKSIEELIADPQSEIKKRNDKAGPVESTKTVEGNRAAAEGTPETNVNDEVQKHLHSGQNDMQKQNYDDVEVSLQKEFVLKPCKSTEELTADPQFEIKNRNDKAGPVVTPNTVEGASVASQNTQTEKPNNKDKHDVIPDSEMYTDWAQDAYEYGDIETAESFLKFGELFHSTKRSRDLQVMILRAKHQNNDSGCDDTNTAVIVQRIRKKKKPKLKVFTGRGYLRAAEETFINGEFKVAHDLVSRSEVNKSSYVIELKEKIEIAKKNHYSGWNWVKWVKTSFSINV